MYFFHPKDEEEALLGIADYLALVRREAEWGQFDVLGHLTLPLRYLNENQGFHLSFDPFEAEVEDILRTAIRNGCGIELNTNRGNTPCRTRSGCGCTGIWGRDHHPGHRRPHAGVRRLRHPGPAGAAAPVRVHQILHL